MADEFDKIKVDEPKVDTTNDQIKNEVYTDDEKCEMKTEMISVEVNSNNEKVISINELEQKGDIPIQEKTFKGKQVKEIYKFNNSLVLSDLFVGISRSLRNPTYLFMTLGVCLDCYALPFYSFLPKYIEVSLK